MRVALGVFCFAVMVATTPAQAQDQDRPSFSGTWQFDASKSEARGKVSTTTLIIEEGDNSIHITDVDAKGKKTESQCTTDGKECKFQGDRRGQFWYNGAMLVEMETKNVHVNKYQMKISEDGKTLTIQMTPIVPQSDKIETLVFQKQSTS